MSAEDEIATLGRDLHHLGVGNSVTIPRKLYEMGWRKTPRLTGGINVIPSALAQPMLQSDLTQIANPNQMIPREQRWMR